MIKGKATLIIYADNDAAIDRLMSALHTAACREPDVSAIHLVDEHRELAR